MSEVSETRLPGVGIRYDFESAGGRRIGVVHHRTGQRELVLYDMADPDVCVASLRLDEADSRTLGEILGASKITEELEDLKQSVEGLAIDWLAGRPPPRGRSRRAPSLSRTGSRCHPGPYGPPRRRARPPVGRPVRHPGRVPGGR